MDILDVRDIFFSFKGRIRRGTWWMSVIGMGFVNWIAQSVIAPMILGNLGRPHWVQPPFVMAYPHKHMWVTLVFGIVLLWPSFALAVKRAHDRGRSGRLEVAMIAIGAVLGWSGVALLSYDLISAATYLVLICLCGPPSLYVLVAVGFLPGTPGANAYGPDPKTTPIQSRRLN